MCRWNASKALDARGLGCEVLCVCSGDRMLLCDACGPNGAHHLDCLEPRLSEVPEGDWFCPKCAATATAPLSEPPGRPEREALAVQSCLAERRRRVVTSRRQGVD